MNLSSPIPAFISIHDLMPQTIDHVATILDVASGIPPELIYLLVVPNLDWSSQQLDQIRRWQAAGHPIVGHGWVHQCAEIKTIYHRVHSLLISRDVAEHLSLSTDEVCELVGNCHRWFVNHDFGNLQWYVPPAWAMGKISHQQMQTLPFRFFESQTGVYDSQTNRFWRIPLVGYEADTLIRATFLTLFNSINQIGARTLNRPLRVSIHPFDLEYRLSKILRKQLSGSPSPATAKPDWRAANSTDWMCTFNKVG